MTEAATLDRTDVPTTRLRVTGMDCASCAAKVEAAVRRLPDIAQVQVSVAAETLAVRHGPGTDARMIADTVRGLGYGAEDPDAVALGDTAETPWWRAPKALLAASCGAALVTAYALGHVAPITERWAFLAAMAVGLVPVARRAILAARHGTPFSIEMLMTIAAVGATIIGATEEAATVVFLFLIGEVLEGVAAGRARASIRGLTGLVPETALLERDGTTESVPAASLKVGATVLVRPGDRVPADGTILDGGSDVDEASVTGESVPRRKEPGDAVFAGTVNGDGALRVRVTAAAKDNTIARVVQLVEEAQEAKAPTERLIDRFSRVYTPAVVAVATLVAVVPPLLTGGAWGDWVYKGLAILLIGCPCALVISTPAAIAAGLSAGARRGLLIKGGAVLERLASVTTVAFDKTGTLTEGKPVVTNVVAFGRSERDVLSLSGALEGGSSHPLARAVLAKAAEAGAPVPPAFGAQAFGGKGIASKVGGLDLFLGSPREAGARVPFTPDQEERVSGLQGEGKTVSVLLANGAVAGLLAMRDEPRSDAREGVDRLASLGVGAIMLTGDTARTAWAVAAALGIEVWAELLPEDKQRIVRERQATGAVVAKVGDGINDAPALAAADVGIAMGGGADVALETADAAALHGRVADIARMIELSRRTLFNIRTNIALALGLKAVFLVTTVLGVTGLWPAILADTGATVLVTANALRLLGEGRSSA
ncbi:heavy metal translocating P-type ATPase [Methylobacterium sp. ARG-1]|uniref:heavy metal translocating P-type ATPase n=1 Tax=Methylobacterium sp. ARG-1 TaxID=1692501 RepID=UPI00067FEFA9|nr:heavy metal translocating P-type ATPase [Methylobacterium sp. ARG-1]KNY24058.1 ATPase [Methylobacterium sp. ARG-1]